MTPHPPKWVLMIHLPKGNIYSVHLVKYWCERWSVHHIIYELPPGNQSIKEMIISYHARMREKIPVRIPPNTTSLCVFEPVCTVILPGMGSEHDGQRCLELAFYIISSLFIGMLFASETILDTTYLDDKLDERAFGLAIKTG